MASYFRQVPNFDYVSRSPGDKYISDYIQVKNLFKRGKLREDIFGNLSFFEKYSIIGDERPDNVAAKFYDDPTLDWVILLSNNILNIQSEWPLSQRQFEKVMLDKYGSYENLYGGIHHYETIEISNSLGITVLKGGIKLSPTWKTNGNFIEAVNTKIENISATENADGVTPSKTVIVYLNFAFNGIQSGDQVTIGGVSENEYNGKFTIKENFGNSFTYDLPEIPKIIKPTLSGKEQVIFTIPEKIDKRFVDKESNPVFYNLPPDRIARYYEYWDDGLGYSVLKPYGEFVRIVTNFEYENNLEEAKRNIYVLKPRYLNVIFNDMDDIMPYKKGSQQYISENLKRGDNIRLYE